MWAAYKGNTELLQLLLNDKRLTDLHVNAVTLDDNGDTALLIALKNDHTEAAIMLLADSRININIADRFGKTALMRAAAKGNTEQLQLLLNDKRLTDQHINAVYVNGDTALLFALKKGHTEAAIMLLEDSRININIADKEDFTPLMWAVYERNTELLKLLSNDKRLTEEYINAVNDKGNTALLIALKKGHTEAIIMLLEDSRININIADKDGFTPLMWAAYIGNTELLQLLLKHNQMDEEHVNTVDVYGDTALLIAIRNNQVEVAKKLLIDERVNIEITNKLGYTALKYAEMNNSNEIRDYIIKIKLHVYLDKITKRDTKYKTSRFGFFEFTKEEKITAVTDLLEAEANDEKIKNKTSLGALHNGELGKIVSLIPEENQKKLGL